MESDDAEDDLIDIEKLEEHVRAQGYRTRCCQPHEARRLLKNRMKNQTQVRYILPPSALSELVYTKRQIVKAPAIGTALSTNISRLSVVLYQVPSIAFLRSTCTDRGAADDLALQRFWIRRAA